MNQQEKLILIGLVALALAIESVSGVITVQIGGATRLTSLSRSRDRYNCYWDCDLVGCQIARDDDECAYDCEKICRIRYDYATVGRSGSAQAAANSDLKPKSDAVPAAVNDVKEADSKLPAEILGGELLKWKLRLANRWPMAHQLFIGPLELTQNPIPILSIIR